MSFFARSSIKRKLTLIIMLTCSVALLLACAAILIFEIAGFKQVLRRNTEVMAQVIGANSAAALSFKDKDAAKETLSALKAEPYVLSACVYNNQNEVFATYYREGAPQLLPPPRKDDSFSFEKDTLNLFHTIRFDGDLLGTVFIQSDLRVVKERLRTYLGIIAFVMASASLVAFVLSLYLQKVISAPISHLADAANKVAQQKNYSIRAAKVSEDEMGQLIDRFNEMLTGIQERDAALLRAQDDLEKRVDERTKELQLEIRERSRVEAELRVSQQKFETLVNSIEGVVWEADPKTFEFAFVSQQAEKLLGFPRSDWTVDPAFWLDHVYNDDQVLAHGLRMKALQQEKPTEIEYRMVAADGRIVWIREISTFIFDNGAPRALRGVFFDITEQKQAEEELDSLNRRLLESSRQAGMAEVATGVLHNVGNVLNSVNVSSTLICDQVRNSRAARLKDVVLLLNKNAADLGNFITNDPKGKIIPGYLNNLSERLAAEQQDLLKELELLTKNVEHIKEIVAMQQNYARVSGIIESLSIRNLVEDALQMNAAALARHGVLVIRDFHEVPVISVDKHKVLQILVNLIRNAKYAIDAAARRDKRLSVTIRMNDRQMIEIAVVDNGIGIAAENLTRIFSHGFTTKRDGHGFGLHSGALAAKEMGGSLTAFSEGVGKGATFILQLPLNAQRAANESRNGGKTA
ncbi:MAG TPA: CHASE sensor domain-containing protein [Verrucomicrobiae bacterium]|jgi:PAS domain S-box-containing protein|nr:CHASE sensor domain-containing protein [Verrucomicrobiae bacterium]